MGKVVAAEDRFEWRARAATQAAFGVVGFDEALRAILQGRGADAVRFLAIAEEHAAYARRVLTEAQPPGPGCSP